MMTRRIIYICTLACLVAFYALYPYWISQYFVVVILLLIPFDLLVSMPGMLTKRLSLSAPTILDIGSDGMLHIVTHRERSFPSGLIRVRLALICNDYSASRKLLCRPEDGSRYSAVIDTSHCGVTQYKINRIHTTSIIGLFSLIIRADCSATVLILPAPEKPKNIVSLPRGVIFSPKPGGGFSENTDLRPYRKGDPIRSIHWKLSAKYDSIIVREPLIPPRHSRLIHIEKWSGARERDIVLGRLRWISEYLLKWDLPHYVRLGDDGPVTEITCEKEFIDYLYYVLGNEERFAAQQFGKSARTKRLVSSMHPPSLEPCPLPPASFSCVFHVDAKEGDKG